MFNLGSLSGLVGQFTSNLSSLSNLSSQATDMFNSLASGSSFTNVLGARTPLYSTREVLDPSSWLAKAKNRPDPLLEFSWDVLIAGPLGLLPSEFIEDITVPLARFDVSHVVMQSSKYYYASTLDYGTANLKLYETYRADCVKFFNQWCNRIRSPNGDYATPSEYKGTGYVYIKDPTNQSNVLVIKLVGIFPSTPGGLQLGAQGNRIQLDQELALDRIELS